MSTSHTDSRQVPPSSGPEGRRQLDHVLRRKRRLRADLVHAPIVWRAFAHYVGVVVYSLTAALVIGRDEKVSGVVPLAGFSAFGRTCSLWHWCTLLGVVREFGRTSCICSGRSLLLICERFAQKSARLGGLSPIVACRPHKRCAGNMVWSGYCRFCGCIARRDQAILDYRRG